MPSIFQAVSPATGDVAALTILRLPSVNQLESTKLLLCDNKFVVGVKYSSPA